MATKTIQSIALDPTDNRRYIVTLTDKIAKGEAAKLNYTKGDVAASDTGLLQNIVNFIITNNVTVAIPHLVSATTNTTGTQVILTFDVDMASPTGKQGEFGVTANSTALALSSATLDTDTKKIVLNINVTPNNQQWVGYPQSPVTLTQYPYQMLYYMTGFYYLTVSTGKLYKNGSNLYSLGVSNIYKFTSNTWNLIASNIPANSGISGIGTENQLNTPLYSDSSCTTIYLDKTTPATSPAITNGQTIKTSYTKGTVLSAQGGVLESYTDVSVTNSVPAPYQQWANSVPQSPVLTSSYPYQMIITIGGGSMTLLTCAKTQFYVVDDNPDQYWVNGGADWLWYSLSEGAWSYVSNYPSSQMVTTVNNPVLQNNTPIYSDITLTTIYKAKTTS